MSQSLLRHPVLDLVEERGVFGTLGRHRPDLVVRGICEGGHEAASYTVWHLIGVRGSMRLAPSCRELCQNCVFVVLCLVVQMRI